MTRFRTTLLLSCGLLSCASTPLPSTRATREDVVVQQGDATQLSAQIHAPNARFSLSSGACDYVHVTARYTDEGIRPAVAYQVGDDGTGTLDAREHARDPTKKHHGKWTVCLRDGIPSSLDVTAVGGSFELSKLNVHALRIDGGDGHVELDMVGVEHPMSVEVSGRSATVGLRLPEQAGLRVHVREAKKAELPGLRRLDDGSYVNELWDRADTPRIELEVEGPELVVFSRKRNWRGRYR